MKLFCCLIFLCNLFLSTAAQKNAENGDGEISGKVIDANSKNLLEYATITVYPLGNPKPVNGTVTNSKGTFKVNGLQPGKYSVTIDFIGYSLNKNDSIIITKEKPSIALGNILLEKKSQVLQNVTITANQSIIENKLDKMIYNVEKDITSQGGVATDVLKKVPQVFVDVDGNVELQGSTSIRFLINGKPSSIFGSSITDALQAIPASQIQSIEVITSPGAKYDAQGTGGIINIILKKSNIRGINGNINLSGGTRLENGSFNFNYRHNNFGINAYASGNAQLRTNGITETNRTSADSLRQTKTNLLQNGSGSGLRNGYQAGIGFDWSITKKDNITGSLGYHYFTNSRSGIINQETIFTDFSNNKLSDTNTVLNSENRSHANAIDWGIDYKRSFKKDKQELEIGYHSSYGKEYFDYSQSQNYLSNIFSGSQSNNLGKNNESEFTIDYTHPIGENFIIETGVKNEETKITSAADVYTYNQNTKNYFLNTNQSYALNFKRDVYAYYLSTTFSVFHFFDIKAGGRYEFTVTNADYSNAHNVNIPSYSIFAPSFVISHPITDNQSIKFSYTHRIERPEYRELNPFVNLSDPHNITTGNPALRPEVGNNFELGYNHSFDKGSNLNVSLFFRKNTDDLTSYTTYYSFYKVGDSTYKDVSLTTRQNINSDERYGVSVSGSLSLNSKFTLRSNVFGFKQRIINILNGGSVNSGYGYRMNINGTYLFNKDLAVEFFGNFRSKETNVQGTQTSFVTYNLALRKQFLKKKLSLGLTATNPFNKYVNQRSETFGSNFQQMSLRQIPFRSFGINLMYKFGKLEFKKIKEEDINTPNAPF